VDDWTDLIDNFMAYTKGIPSPEIFRLWAGISLVAGALERRVWSETARSVLYPNLYVLLVAPPAVGKSQALAFVEDLWYSTKKFHIAPSNATKASLIDCIEAADGKRLVKGQLIEYHSLLAVASEFGVMIPEHDLEFLSVLTYIYDNPPRYGENRRSLAKQVDIVNPQLNMIAGTQPGFLSTFMPEVAWSQGFTSRLIMIYAGSAPRVRLFGDGTKDPRLDLRKKLISQLTHLSTLFGQATWSKEAEALLEAWIDSGQEPVPDHSKLTNYASRRTLHILKLSMVAAVSRQGKPTIEVEDVRTALAWLLQAEEVMPDIFRDMTQKSDSQVMQEMHFFMWKLWVKDKQPIHESRVIHFLSTRLPADKIGKVVEMAEKANIITRSAGSTAWIPRPSNEHGVE
jgi:hypothetical protein